MSTENPVPDDQNSIQPGEFDDLDTGKPANETTLPDTPELGKPKPKEDPPEEPTETEQETPTEASPKREEEELTDLRAFKKKQDKEINELISANTKLQEKLVSAEKQHKVRQDSAVEAASDAVKATVKQQMIGKLDTVHRNFRIVSVFAAIAVIALCLIVGHDVFESAPSSPPAADTVPVEPKFKVRRFDDQKDVNFDTKGQESQTDTKGDSE